MGGGKFSERVVFSGSGAYFLAKIIFFLIWNGFFPERGVVFSGRGVYLLEKNNIVFDEMG